jgi:hypothetical protein
MLAPRRGVAMFIVALIGTVHLLPELANPVWQDEAATLMIYASGNVRDAFADYTMPNNHMLFSAALSLVWSPGEDGIRLRLLPLISWFTTLLIFAGAMPRFAFATRVCAVALFSASAVTAAFALQLRGYAFSWPFALLVCASAPAFVVDGKRSAGIIYLLASVASVAILPSNALIAACCSGWTLLILIAQRQTCRRAWQRALLASVVPIAALALYLPHLEQLRQHANAGWSDWTDRALIGHWLLAAGGQYLPLLPLFAAGLWPALRAHARSLSLPDEHGGLLLGALGGGTLLALLILPIALFPRVLVPLLPLWCLAFGVLLQRVWCVVAVRWPHRSPAVALLAVVLVYVVVQVMPACAGLGRGDLTRANLCGQFYREDYAPRAAFEFLRHHATVPQRPVMLDSEAAWALGFLAWNENYRGLRLVEYRAWRAAMPGNQRPAIVVTKAPGALARMLKFADLGQPRAARKIYDRGFFEIWHLYWSEPPAGSAAEFLGEGWQEQ